MNPVIFELSNYALKALSSFSRSRVRIEGEDNIPEGSVIFCPNHFTRIETIILPYRIYALTQKKVWSLAARELFDVPYLEGVLNSLGAVSTGASDRDELILKTLMPGNAHWIIFPEGMMVKNKKLVSRNRFSMKDDTRARLAPHTGPAVLAMACEFYRQRIARLYDAKGPEYHRLASRFDLKDADAVIKGQTFIVPVNISYYPAKPRENLLASLAARMIKAPSKRVMDELLIEGGILFSGVNIIIRFGQALDIAPYLNYFYFESMLQTERRVRFKQDTMARQAVKQASRIIMTDYMHSVYAMTAVNHDHIMACILKHFPYRKQGIELYEFKCKVFYAAEMLKIKKLCYLSNKLVYNQIHLLTDDRFNRISDFIDTAVKTGVIKITGSKMQINHTRFIQKASFHTVRMENPILVMANEIEPLTRVEAFLAQVAQKTFKDIRDRVRYRLKEKIDADFFQDYSTFYISGESKDKDVGMPLFLEHAAEDKNAYSSIGILLIHGYMAAPMEVKAFAMFLHNKGFTVFVPRLKGHGTSPEDLAQTSYNQWVESAEEALVALDSSCEKIVIGGFSTGAGIALDLAARFENHQAVFALAPPMALNDLGAFFVPAVDTWNNMINKLNLNVMAKQFIANDSESPHINYLRNPIAGVHQLEKLMDQLEPKLKTLEKPVLVGLSRKDTTVSVKGAEKLFRLIGSQFKEFYLFDYDRHGIINGDGALRVYRAVSAFIESVLGLESPFDDLKSGGK